MAIYKMVFNMKRDIFIILIVAATLSTGCSVVNLGPIKRYNDDFTGGTRYLLHESIEPREWGTDITTADLTFEKRVSSMELVTRIYFVAGRSAETFGADLKGYIKVDDLVFDIYLADISSAIKYSGSNIVTEGVLREAEIDSEIDDKFIVDLHQGLVDAILDGRRMEIRLYFGPVPATYRISGLRLGRVKKLLSR
jgi:hypothetical protein